MTLLMQYISDYHFSYIINSQSLASEFISVSISGIGCCLVVPIATIIGAAMIQASGKTQPAEADRASSRQDA
jgi:uncharacterized membrane protein